LTGFDACSGTVEVGLAGGSTVALAKTTSGTVTLNGANTYAGGTTISAGTLLVNNSSGSGTGVASMTVNNAGTLLGSSRIFNAGGVPAIFHEQRNH
jgi:autotransporter-associated beta strand protein